MINFWEQMSIPRVVTFRGDVCNADKQRNKVLVEVSIIRHWCFPEKKTEWQNTGIKPETNHRIFPKRISNYQKDLYLFFFFFLAAGTQLYKRLCPSVGRSVHWSIGASVRWSVMIELKSAKTRIFGAAVELLRICECVWGGRGCGWGYGWAGTLTMAK